MTTAREWIEQIEARRAQIREALTPEAWRTFEARYFTLTDALTAGDDPEQVAAQLRQLVMEFPAVARLLEHGNLAPSPPSTESPLSAPSGGQTMTPSTPAPQPAPAEPSPRGFKTEDFIQIFKEAVTALIAILLVWTTISLVRALLGTIGDASRFTQAKDILSMMTGLLGVVLGYYFGRIPAEARAAQAQEQAAQAIQKGEQAMAQSKRMGERAGELAELASQLASQMQAAPAPRAQSDVSQALQAWAAGAEELRRMAREH
jgi:hypothetical protein